MTTIIPCGVDLRHFQPGLKSETPTVLFVGTTGGRKRGTLLGEIFQKEILPSFPEARLWSVAEKPLEGKNVVNFGKVPLETLTDLYRKAWVFCLPSTYEGFGVPYIEAMASGTAVVATPTPGAREVLQEGQYGLLAGDAQIAEQIKTLLDSEEKRHEYERRGLARAGDYDWPKVAAQYEEVYGQLIMPKSAKLCHVS